MIAIDFGVPFDMEQAVKRMSARSSKALKWTLKGVTIEWRYIPATSARNWDGSSAGGGQDASKEILQRMVWKDGACPRFTNWW
jgi:hypothetical protein